MFTRDSRNHSGRHRTHLSARVLALALTGLCVASTDERTPGVPPADVPDFCGRCVDFGDRYHLAAADPGQRFGVGPAPAAFEETPWHDQVVRGGSCLWKHGICHNANGFKPRDQQALTDAVEQAAAQGDAVALASLVDLAGIEVVRDRSVIQVLACDGRTVLGQVPVDRALLDTVVALATELE